MSDERNPGLRISFLRKSLDRRTFLADLSEESQDRLSDALTKEWNDFVLTWTVAQQSREFAGLLDNLRLPSEKEWEPGWFVRWQICLQKVSPPAPHPPLDAYFLQVLQIKRKP